MKTPKTPIEFDYDLWTTEDGKCMVRVKITGEVTEVDREVMKALRAEEKRIRRALRSNEGTVKDGIAHQTRTFSLSAVSENELEKSTGWSIRHLILRTSKRDFLWSPLWRCFHRLNRKSFRAAFSEKCLYANSQSEME